MDKELGAYRIVTGIAKSLFFGRPLSDGVESDMKTTDNTLGPYDTGPADPPEVMVCSSCGEPTDNELSNDKLGYCHGCLEYRQFVDWDSYEPTAPTGGTGEPTSAADSQGEM